MQLSPHGWLSVPHILQQRLTGGTTARTVALGSARVGVTVLDAAIVGCCVGVRVSVGNSIGVNVAAGVAVGGRIVALGALVGVAGELVGPPQLVATRQSNTSQRLILLHPR
jgi:hypothetical protein